jgi:putative transcriptional regulator
VVDYEAMPIKIHLSRLLGERKIRAAELSRQTGISQNTLSKFYHEKAKGIEFETLEKLCRALGCSVSDLLQYSLKTQQSENV